MSRTRNKRRQVFTRQKKKDKNKTTNIEQAWMVVSALYSSQATRPRFSPRRRA